jgi:hypothetical protein
MPTGFYLTLQVDTETEIGDKTLTIFLTISPSPNFVTKGSYTLVT